LFLCKEDDEDSNGDSKEEDKDDGHVHLIFGFFLIKIYFEK